ncbi:MAG: OstA-like protein [Candidatus Egerieousia sp.]
MDKVRTLSLILSLLFASLSTAVAQNENGQKDSLVRLIEANAAKLIDRDGVVLRKIEGPARFLHNNTYLLCDTAIWDVNTNIIDAIGNVQIIQDGTCLIGESLKYIVESNLAQFRGSKVTLMDKDNNMLCTHNLDYNTKDSVATFFGGGSLRSKDGEIIESLDGTYDSKINLFVFYNSVELFSDSLFAKSTRMEYDSNKNVAYFGPSTIGWKGDNMLQANGGEYAREREIVTFEKNAYLFSKEQEVWGDKIVYNRRSGDAELYGNIQITDTVQSVLMFADKATYQREPLEIILTQRPAIAMYSVQNGNRDTIYASASDSIRYYTKPFAELDSAAIAAAKARKGVMIIDPMKEIEKLRQEKLKEARSGRKEGRDENAGNSSTRSSGRSSGRSSSQANIYAGQRAPEFPSPQPDEQQSPIEQQDSIPSAGKESMQQIDSTAILAERELDAQIMRHDTCTVTFVEAWHNIKLYGKDYQGVCDSLIYTGIDSIARLYIEPILWSDAKNQFLSDSIFIQIRNDSLYKADFINNAFIITQEDTVHYNQIKSAEMMAYFKNNDIWRFDALGGASLIFYMEEDSTYTMINQKECKILSALIKERKIERIRYYDQLKSDLLPIYDLPINKQRLRGFKWLEERRPKSREEVMPRAIRSSQRRRLKAEPMPEFKQTSLYFPDSMQHIVEIKESLNF